MPDSSLLTDESFKTLDEFSRPPKRGLIDTAIDIAIGKPSQKKTGIRSQVEKRREERRRRYSW